MTEKSSLRIAFLSAYSGPVQRGIEGWVSEIASRLAKQHSVVVYQLGEDPGGAYPVKTVPTPVAWDEPDMTNTPEREHDIDYWSGMLGRFTFDLLPDLLEFAPDIVLPLNGSWEVPICRKYCDYSGAKMVLVGQNYYEKELAYGPDLYIATSDAQAERIRSLFEGPVEVIYNAVDISRFTPEGGQRSLDLSRPRILTVGALVDQKHIRETVRAVGNLPEASLVVCGDGDLREEVCQLGEDLLGDRFLLLSLNYDEMPALYRACDLFTFTPDPSEAFGLVYLEAMASGLGVVALDDGLRRKIVGEAGIFVADPHDEAAYAEVLAEALETDFGGRPRQQAEGFSWDKAALAYNELFLSIL